MDPSVGVIEDERVQGWLLVADKLLVRCAAIAVGRTELNALSEHFERDQEFVKAARIKQAYIAVSFTSWDREAAADEAAVLDLLKKADETSDHIRYLPCLAPSMLGQSLKGRGERPH